MKTLFWVFWILDLLLFVINLWAIGFRKGFGAGIDFNQVFLVVLILLLAAALWSKVTAKPAWLSLGLAALPLIGMFIWYLVDSSAD